MAESMIYSFKNCTWQIKYILMVCSPCLKGFFKIDIPKYRSPGNENDQLLHGGLKNNNIYDYLVLSLLKMLSPLHILINVTYHLK